MNEKSFLRLCGSYKRVVSVISLLFVSLFSEAKDKPQLTLVKDGKSNYSIWVSEKATKNEQTAALMLQSYIQQITGCTLPVSDQKTDHCIIISTEDKVKNPDGFTINTNNTGLIIKGGNRKGCIYGVVYLLEHYLGCHYYSKDYKVIPHNKNLTLPYIDFADEPLNDCRIINISDQVDQEFIDWNRLNTIEEYYAQGYYVHTFNRLVPWQEYYKSHPEYFAFMNGKRIIDQLCLSNPDVLKLVIDKLQNEMSKQPDKLYWSVSQNDNFSFCHCDQCQKIIDEEKSPAGPIIRFVNKVAERFPDKIISTLAYQFSRPAPVVTKPLSNVQLMLCTIELNRSIPIEQDPGSQSFVKDIQDWGKICKRIYLWDYTIDFAHSVSPFPNLHVLQPNIQFFCKNNVRAHFQQSNISIGQEFSELKLYLISRLLWNPNTNIEELKNEFLNGYYGKAGFQIRQYMDRLESESVKSGTGLDIYGHPVAHQNDYLSFENVLKYDAYFKDAEQAVKNDSGRLLHTRIARLPLQYAMMEIGKNDMFGKRGWYIEKGDNFILNDTMKQMLETFYATCKQSNVTHLNESGLTPKDYYESSLRFINIQVKGNYAFRKKVTAKPLPSTKYSNGDLSFLTNGVRGANDYKVHWLGWEGKNFSLVLDLEKPFNAKSIEISTLWDAKSWILHPASVTCLVSENGVDFITAGELKMEGDQQKTELTRVWQFKPGTTAFRYVKFEVKGTLRLPDWHPSAGGSSWVFVDEIVIK